MPKPFTIAIDVEEVAFGSVIRKLNALPGIVALHLDFDKPDRASHGANGADAKPDGEKKPRGRPRGPAASSKGFEITGNEALAQILRGKPKAVADMRAGFEALGRSPHSVSSLLYHGLTDGWISKLGSNSYKLTGKIPKAKRAKKTKKAG